MNAEDVYAGKPDLADDLRTYAANVIAPHGMRKALQYALIMSAAKEIDTLRAALTPTPDATITSTVERCANFAQEAVLDIGCTAIEAEGIVRRTRDAIAAGLRALATGSRTAGDEG